MTAVAGLLVLGFAIGMGYAAIYFCFDDVRTVDSLTLGIFGVWIAFCLSLFAIAIRVLWHGITLLRGQGRALEILRDGTQGLV